MNEGGGNHNCFIWENNEGWSFLNSNDLVESGEKFASDKLSDLNRSDTCQPLTVAKAIAETNTVDIKKAKSDGESGEGESDHEIHILTERERRKKMRNMFSNLHALLPQLPPKADKSTIVDEAVNYIKTLQNTLQKLQKQKLERLQYGMSSQKLLSIGSSREGFLADQGSTSNSAAITPTNNLNNIPAAFQTWTSPNVVLNVCGEEAHISVCCPKKPGIFSSICYVLEKYKIEIVSAQVSSDHYRSMFMIQAHASGGSSLDQFSVEDIYKQAAAEIILWTTSK